MSAILPPGDLLVEEVVEGAVESPLLGWVADDGLIGVPREDLMRLMACVVEMYEEIYMGVDLKKRQKSLAWHGRTRNRARRCSSEGTTTKSSGKSWSTWGLVSRWQAM